MEQSTHAKQPFTIAVIMLSGLFFALGGLFVFVPGAAGPLYGIDGHERDALAYVRAVGLRDLALAAYLFGLAAAGQRRALQIVMFGTLIIPVGDIALLVAFGVRDLVHYLLHGASLLCFAAFAWWGGWPPRRQ